MKKKLYFVVTNGYNMLISVDGNKNCKYLIENEEFPYILDDDPEEQKRKVLDFLESIELADDLSWDEDCTYEQLFEGFPDKIIAEVEKEF